jgi:hypothetical protein
MENPAARAANRRCPAPFDGCGFTGNVVMRHGVRIGDAAMLAFPPHAAIAVPA